MLPEEVYDDVYEEDADFFDTVFRMTHGDLDDYNEEDEEDGDMDADFDDYEYHYD